ncbi:methyltransferase domain-containing protein [Streptomyces axinellae]|uniref:Protein-L-isoaspartate O-methyltransferase n=1 Tax=Streptomyces axinellae TaxID=552788 RepID=A0ABN3PRW9_9ACTN
MTSPEHLLLALRKKAAPLAGWEAAVAAVPRELFLPDIFETPHGILSRRSDPAGWLQAVYEDWPLTTQVNDGNPVGSGGFRLPTSSSSMPSMMLQMLDLLRVSEGDRVLDVGAGTGYQTAWLAHRLGDEHVIAVDVDPELVKQAESNVRAAGYQPRMVCGDGTAGWPPGAPYGRIIASYTVPEIPYTWVEQAPGGRIVAPWGGSFFGHSFAVLDVGNGKAHGRFTGHPAFMRSRPGRPQRGFLRDWLHHQDDAIEASTRTNPLAISRDADALFHLDLAVHGVWHMEVEADDDSGEVTWWLLSDDRSSWAAADYVPDQHQYVIAQYGPRQLWDEVETAWTRWDRIGRPGRDRVGITVTPEGQHLWLDKPGNHLPAP